MKFIELRDNALRQYIDSRAVFEEVERTRLDYQSVRGGMIWKGDYLVRTSPTGGQKGLGARSLETEKIYDRFMARKAEVTERLADLEQELKQCAQRNRIEGVGRSPGMLVDILNQLEQSGVAEHFMIVGTHALYAYEQVAGVRITEAGALATRDVDLLWDTRKRIQFVTQMNLQSSSMLGILREVDPTFRPSDEDRYKAVNSRGFEVDIIRREARHGDPHPLRMTDHEEEFWVVQARDAHKLLDAPRLSTMVVSARGRMARMTTIAPGTFIDFKRWMAAQADREPAKRSRDQLQAEIVEQLLGEQRFPAPRPPNEGRSRSPRP